MDEELMALRQAQADRYLEPDPHMALARYHHDRGDRIQAFYLLEGIRRSQFEPPVFDAAFREHFLDEEPFDNSPEAEAELLQKVSGQDADFESLSNLADIYVSRSDWTNADRYLRLALEKKPNDFVTIDAIAEVYSRSGRKDMAQLIRDKYHETFPENVETYVAKSFGMVKEESAGAREYLEQGIRKYPEESALHFNLALLHQGEEKWQQAEASFVRAAELAPESAEIQGWTGRFLLKTLDDKERAFEYYLNAYFLDPHFYDTEHAEFRIGTLNQEFAMASFEPLSRTNDGLKTALAHPNPAVIGHALQKVAESWDGIYLDSLVDLMKHDISFVRGNATWVLAEHAGQAIEKRLDELLTSSDLRQRGLAAYLAVKLRGEEAFGTLREFLDSDCQLLRLDAILALSRDGGPAGIEIVRAHRSTETHPLLQKTIDDIGRQE